MPALTAGSTISSASMRIWNTDGSSTGRAISLYKNLGGWDNDNLTWNNKPNSYETESRPFNKEYITFSGSHFLSGIRMMYSGEANNGFMLRYTDESKSNPDYNAFYTSNCAFSKRAERPLLTLSYQAPANIANGVYYIRNRKSSLYMDAEQDLSHNGNVIQYTFHGGSNQQWKVEKQSDGYYKLTNLYPQHNGKVLDVASGVVTNDQNIQIYASNNTPAQRWAFFSNGDGSYRLMPKAGNQAMCISVSSGSMSSTANVNLYDYVAAPEQGWFLEKATVVGAASSYRQENSNNVNCLGYVLELNYTPDLSIYPTDNLQSFSEKTQALIRELNRGCRVLTSKDDLIHPTREYKIAMRIRDNFFDEDYHFMVQLNTGKWAQKHGGKASDPNELVSDPTNTNWGTSIFDLSNYYHSDTVYYAVTR